MKQYNYILLDWDGNIAQTLNLWPNALDIVLQKQAITLDRWQLIKACAGVAAFLAANTKLSEAEGRVVLQDATEIVKQRLPTVELYPDAIEVLQHLKNEGKHLALITSSLREVVEPVLKKFALDSLFDATICLEDVTHRKPDPEPLQKALLLLGGRSDQAIMVGDTKIRETRKVIKPRCSTLTSVTSHPSNSTTSTSRPHGSYSTHNKPLYGTHTAHTDQRERQPVASIARTLLQDSDS